MGYVFLRVFRALGDAVSLGGRVVIVRLVRGDSVVSDVVVNGKALLGVASDAVIEVANETLAKGRVVETVIGDVRVIAEPVEVRPTIIVVGSGSIAKALVVLGERLVFTWPLSVMAMSMREPSAMLTSLVTT